MKFHTLKFLIQENQFLSQGKADIIPDKIMKEDMLFGRVN